MIVSHRRNFVFVHIFKTAGTSIKRALRRHAMPGWQEPMNHLLKRIGIPQFGPAYYPDHMTAGELIDQISLEKFSTMYSFAFVRNPWDWELSHYKYILRHPRHQVHQEVKRLRGFSEYVRWRCDGRQRTQKSFLTFNGQRVVDFVGRFETIDADFQSVARQLGISPKLKRLNQTRPTVYQRHYDHQTVNLICDAYQEDIDAFGYRFDGRLTAAA
jgi:hypothetical protein